VDSINDKYDKKTASYKPDNDVLNKIIKESLEKVEFLERQKRLQENRQKKTDEKINTRRKIIIGGLVEKYFPIVKDFNPKRLNADTEIEFLPFENFLKYLANDKEYLLNYKRGIND
jgi:hypothetical protein